MFWFMTYASTVGYSEMQVYNDKERILLLIFIYVGCALFAIGFGLMSSQTSIIPNKFIEIFINIR